VLEVAPAEDQEPVKALGTDGANESFSDRVRLRCSHGCLDDPDAFAAEDFVEGAAVFAVSVADEKPHAVIWGIEAEVACLLCHPLAGRVAGAAGEPDTTARMGDEEELRRSGGGRPF
jgi:hypothetical protein